MGSSRSTSGPLVPGQLLRQLNRRAHTGGVSFALSGDIIRGAMVRRSANKGQAQGPVDAMFEGDRFEGSKALVMVHCHNRFVITSIRIVEQGVGTERPYHVNPALLRGTDGGRDGLAFFIAQLAAFPGMGIKSADGDPGPRQAELLARFGG